MRKLFLLLPLLFFFSTRASANTVTAASCNASDVQSAINSTSEGGTVIVPAGTCTWTSGVTISGKGITVQGAGSGRIIARTSNTLTIGTGTLTITGLTFSPGFSSTTLTTGLVLKIFQEGGCVSPPASGSGPCQYNVNGTLNWMSGTVTSYTGGTLTMNITTDQVCPAGTCGPLGGVDGTGSASTHRWLIATIPQTTMILNTGTTTAISITEDTSVNTRIGGFKLLQGTTTGYWIRVNKATGGLPVVGQNLWLEGNYSGGDWINLNTNQGVWANNSFDSAPFSFDPNPFQIQPYDETSWATTAYWGALDTTGTHAVYIETSDFHAFLGASDNDEGGRLVLRYNVYDNAGIGSHGADTGPIGMRTLEWYNNTGVFDGYNDGTTFPMEQWFYARGGTFVIHDNTLPALTSNDYGTKSTLEMIVMQLQRDSGPNACWGVLTEPISPNTNGAGYPAPRQIGLGNVTGNGVAPTGVVNITGGGNSATCGTYTNTGPANTSNFTNPVATCPEAIISNITSDAITSLALTFPGSSFTSAPSVAISGGFGTGATGTAAESGGVLTGVTLTNGGSGFTGIRTYSAASYGYSATEYVGDSEPAYIWNNNGGTPLNVGLGDSGVLAGDTSPCSTGSGQTYDTTKNYVLAGRDYFNNGTAKPGYTPYTYPHPLDTTVGVTVTPSLSFASTVVGNTSTDSPMNATLTNNSGSSISITGVSLTGTNSADFTEAAGSPACTGTVTNTSTCVVAVSFSPLTGDTGSLVATLNIIYTGATGSPVTASLSGTGLTSNTGPTPAISILPVLN